MKILVTGKNGQLGSELQDVFASFPSHEVVYVDREGLDLSNPNQISKKLDQIQPQLIINAAAYTAVDKAESDQDTAYKVNVEAVAKMSTWASKNKAKIIHISTDYVFDGTSAVALTEDHNTAPINIYGATKRKGEEAVIDSSADYIIIRTAWVYSSYGANFVKTMMRLMSEREEIGVVSDQVGSPTYANDLAKVIVHIIDSSKWKNGIYHYSNEGEISWYDFACAIKEIKDLDCKINPIKSSAFPTPAKRPSYSLLDKTKIKNTFNIEIPYWKESLDQLLKII